MDNSIKKYWRTNSKFVLSTLFGIQAIPVFAQSGVRDYTNLSSIDLTTFTGGKNGDDPITAWEQPA